MILLIGPSASGKTEISKLLGLRYGISKAITHTTRAPRNGEVYGVDYYFVQEEDKKANHYVISPDKSIDINNESLMYKNIEDQIYEILKFNM